MLFALIDLDTGLSEQRLGLLRVEVYEALQFGVIARETSAQETVGGFGCHWCGQVFDDGIAIDQVRNGLAELDIVKRSLADIKEQIVAA